MTNKILKAILSVAISVLMASFVLITGVLYQYFGNVQRSQLKDELSLAARATEQVGEDYLAGTDTDRCRLTWIASDGSVIFDSYAEAKEMENHADREEIREALTGGTGSSTRYSATLTQQTIYEATRLKDGSVLRISVSHATALVLLLGMLQPFVLILIIAVILSVWLARRMAKSVVEPLNKLNLEKPMENDTYEELSPLLHRIHTQHQQIRYQMQNLKQKQNEFDKITGNIQEALILLDPAGKIVSINPAAKKMYSIKDTCIGQDFLTVDRRNDMRHALDEVYENAYACFRRKKNDREYQFEVKQIDAEGNMQGIIILVFDITERVNAEQYRKEFTANVSHELKTPLQSIIGSAELMENGIVKEEDIKRFSGNIRKEGTRMVHLIEDIIRLSQLDEETEMPEEEVSLQVISEEVCEMLEDAAKQKGVSLEVSGDEGIFHGVRRLLYEMIYNLCDNAVRYNQPGGYVKIRITEEPEDVLVSVSDNGIGIAPEYQEKIFERFFRVDKSHSRKSGGTGLGLSIVKHVAQYHHGMITVDSEPGNGTTITIRLRRKK